MAVILAGDPDRVIKPVDLTSLDPSSLDSRLSKKACMEAMHLLRSDGKIDVGYDAVVRIMSWTPLFWIPSLLRFVPGVNLLGRAAYRRIANSRPRDVPCTDDVCGLESRPKPARDGSSTVIP